MQKKIKLGILATHPIQYQAPLFRELFNNPELDTAVYYCHKPTAEEQGVGFGVPFQWDVDLTSGYQYVWLKNYSRQPALNSFWGYNTPEIVDIIKNKKVDVLMVHGWSNRSCWQAFLACWCSRTALLVRSDSQLGAQRSSSVNLLKKIIYPMFIKLFDVCLPYGQRSAEYFKYYGARRIEISPHFVNDNWFKERVNTERKQRSALRAKWGFRDDDIVFLFAGKFEPKKRPLDVVNALKAAIQKGAKNIAVLMVGDGALKKQCENVAKFMELPISFAGFLNQGDMSKAYAVSDCLLLCSDYRETWGLVVNEAMACGLPAVVSKEAGCVPDLIIEGETGFTYDKGDIEQLSLTIAYLANNRMKLKQLGQIAQRHIQSYNPSKAAEIITEIVTTLRNNQV